MDEEVATLTDRGTWELVTRTAGTAVVTCKWVYTLKYKADGSIDRYKARLVARGFTQTYGIDYAETFSPMARLNSIKVLLSLAINHSWEIQMGLWTTNGFPFLVYNYKMISVH